MHKIWVKAKHLQHVLGYTVYSPMWYNQLYSELNKLQYAANLRKLDVTHLRHIFKNGKLLFFAQLQSRYNVPHTMHFYYLQLQHAIKAQQSLVNAVISPTPIFSMMQSSPSRKGFISRC